MIVQHIVAPSARLRDLLKQEGVLITKRSRLGSRTRWQLRDFIVNVDALFILDVGHKKSPAFKPSLLPNDEVPKAKVIHRFD